MLFETASNNGLVSQVFSTDVKPDGKEQGLHPPLG